MKKIQSIHNIIKEPKYTKKIRLYFSTKEAGDYFDSYEKTYDYTELNPLTIRGVVTTITPEALVWKQYGLSEIGAVEIITEAKYKNWFETCVKVEIDSEFYTVFKDSTGGRAILQKRPNDILRVILSKR